jgi:ASC-1-like (ASCH) protein
MPGSSELITSAAAMASFLHRRQTRFVRGRLPWVPYIEHPLRVALRLMRWGVRDPEVVAAALLHDVVEDCSGELLSVFGRQDETALGCLARLFGDGTAQHVYQVTNPAAVVDLDSYQLHVAALAWSETPAVLIKASDLKDNAGCRGCSARPSGPLRSTTTSTPGVAGVGASGRPQAPFLSFTVKELGRLMTARPTGPLIRAHEMGIYKPYFDLIAAGRKTTEIRVNDSSRKDIKPGSLIRFRCQGDEVLTRVTRVARYVDFEAMFDSESVASVNPLATRDEQLANIRQIYPPEREELGVVAIGIELVDSPSQ